MNMQKRLPSFSLTTPRTREWIAALLLFPLWWYLGLDQLVWLLLISLLTILMLIRRGGRLNLPAAGRVFLLFFASMAVSALFIDETFRLFSFAQNYLYFIVGFLCLLLTINLGQTFADLESLTRGVLLLMAFSALLGFLSELGVWRPLFHSPLASVMPSFLEQSRLASRFSFRTTGHDAFFMGIRYFRVNGMFLYSTLYGTILALATPFSFYIWSVSKGFIAKIFFGIISLLLVSNLLFTGGRSALLAFALGGAYFWLIRSRRRGTWWWIFWGVAALALVAVAYYSAGDSDATGATAQDLVMARSTSGRMNIYRQTIAAFWEYPVFGAGTQRDAEDLTQPLGSHSYYLALLFRFGLVGFGLFAWLFWQIWKGTAPLSLTRAHDPRLHRANLLLQYGRWFLVARLFDAFFTVPLTDATVIMLEWTLIGILLQARRLALAELRTQSHAA